MTPSHGLTHGALTFSGFPTLAGPVARGLLSLPFVLFGAMHFTGADQMTGAVPSWLPGDVIWVYLTGVALVAGGVGLWTRRLMVPAALGLAALMGVFVLTVHLPGLADEATRHMATIGTLKDIGLAGGLLAIAGARSK